MSINLMVKIWNKCVIRNIKVSRLYLILCVLQIFKKSDTIDVTCDQFILADNNLQWCSFVLYFCIFLKVGLL